MIKKGEVEKKMEINKDMLDSILRKRQASIPLTDKEEHYARKVFDAMMSSKKSVAKVVKVITGEQARSNINKADQEPTRELPPVYPYKQYTEKPPMGDNPVAEPDETLRDGEKLPDVDEKDKTITTEEKRMSDYMQASTDNPANELVVQPSAKFVSMNPALVGDVVVKNFAKTGMHVVKGVVFKVDSEGRAVVKWANGLTTYEWAHVLVKDHAVSKAPKDTESKLKEMKEGEEHPPVKKSVSNSDIEKDVREGEVETEVEIVGKPVGRKPKQSTGEAIAEHVVEEKVKKDGDIAPEPINTDVVQATPFQSLVCLLEHVINLASCVKGMQGTHSDDEEVSEYLDGVLVSVRGIASDILSALSMELGEAEHKEES